MALIRIGEDNDATNTKEEFSVRQMLEKVLGSDGNTASKSFTIRISNK